VLSPFGLVPAAAAGIDVRSLVTHALAMVRSCGADVPPHENPGVQLGLAMGLAGLDGRDKVTVTSSEKVADFGAWAEQLIAESTGKDGKGLIPIDGEPLADPSLYGNDRFFIDIRTEGEDDASHDDRLKALEAAGHPVARIVMKSIDHIGQEFFRFEMATAVAGAVLGINPFNEPNVQEAKDKTRAILAQGAADRGTAAAAANGISVYSRFAGASPAAVLKAALDSIRPHDYVAFLSYLSAESATEDAVLRIRLTIRERKRVASTFGVGPRYLHSTGQYHKGGPNGALAFVITADDETQTEIPEAGYTFAILKRAQALGDVETLEAHSRRTVRIHLRDANAAPRTIERLFADALK